MTLGFARNVAKDQVATYQQLNLLYGIVAPLLLAGIPTALLYFVPRAGTSAKSATRGSRALYLLLGATGLAAATAVIAVREPLAALFNNEGLARAMAWYAPYIFFAFVAAVAPPALTASGPRERAVLNALVGVATMTCIIAAAVRPTGTGLAIALSASGALLAVASVSTVRRATGMRLAVCVAATEDTKRMLAYGMPLAATGLAATLGYQFDRIVVGVTFTPREFAVYALGAVEIPLGLLMPSPSATCSSSAHSALAGRRPGGMIAVWREAMRKTGLVLLPLFAFALVMSTDLVRLLYGSGYPRASTSSASSCSCSRSGSRLGPLHKRSGERDKSPGLDRDPCRMRASPSRSSGHSG